MRYEKINKKLFIENRRRLVKSVKPVSVVVVNANDIMPANADGTLRFCRNSDLFYLIGVDQKKLF
jgi:Xaa-Pro aminopeptidase